MPNLRRHRLFTVFVALCSLLFMQLAVAAYACPGQVERAREAAAITAMAEAGLPCAGGEMAPVMDQDQPGLCHAHCQSAQQSVDKTAGVSSLAAASVGFVLVVPADLPAPPPLPPQAPLLSRSTAPPIAVRHCCFRI